MKKGRTVTVNEMDRLIGDLESQLSDAKKRRKEAVKAEREMAKEWKPECLTAIGEVVCDAAGCKWNELDIASLAEVLAGSEMPLDQCVSEGRGAAEAKEGLDAFKRSRRKVKRAVSVEAEDDGADEESGAESVGVEQVNDAGVGFGEDAGFDDAAAASSVAEEPRFTW